MNPPTEKLLIFALLGVLAWGLVDLGGVGTQSLYKLFLGTIAVTLATVWMVPVRRLGWLGLVILVVGGWLAVEIARQPPFMGRGDVHAALGLAFFCCVRWLVGADARVGRWLAGGLCLLGTVEIGWGFWTSGPASGTFFNPNHFAAFSGAILGLALGCLHGGWRTRWMLPIAGVAGLAGLGVWTSGSRGGLVAAAVMLVFVALVHALRSRRQGRGVAAGWIAAALIVVVALGAGVHRELSRGDISDVLRRLTIYQDTVALISEHPWTGVGPGMYAWRFRPYQSFDTEKRFEHAHNDALEVAAEWGIPIAVLLFGSLGWWLLQAIRRLVTDRSADSWSRAVSLGGLAAVVSILVHGLVDFPLQIPAVLMTFSAALALAGGETSREPSRHPLVTRGLVSLVLIVAAISAGRQLVAVERGRQALEAGDLEAAASAGSLWPPFHFRLGMLHRDEPEHRDLAAAKRSLERAAELNPYSWRYRFELARFYEGAGRLDLAEEAYLEALERNPRSVEYRYRIAGFFLRRGEPERGRVLLRQALAEDDDLLIPAAELLLSLGTEPAEMLRWWPQHPSARRALVEVMSRVEVAAPPEIHDAAWRDWLTVVPAPQIGDADFYVDRLLETGAVAEARRAWVDLAEAHGLTDEEFVERRNDLWNGSFEKPLTRGTLDWQYPDSGQTLITRTAMGEEWALRLAFTDERHFRRLRQVVVVDPERRYTLSFRARSRDLSSPAGLRLQIFDPASREVLHESAPISGSMDWQRFEGDFDTVGPTIIVRLAAPPGNGEGPSERVISGELWLDSILLRPS